MIETSLYCFRWIMSKLTICWTTIMDILNSISFIYDILKIIGYALLIGIGFKIIIYLIGRFTGEE